MYYHKTQVVFDKGKELTCSDEYDIFGDDGLHALTFFSERKQAWKSGSRGN